MIEKMLYYNKDILRQGTKYDPRILYPAKLTFNDKTIDNKCKISRNIVSMSIFLGIYWRLSFRHPNGRKGISVKTCGEPVLHEELT